MTLVPYLPPLDVPASPSWVINGQVETFDHDTARQAAGWGCDVEPVAEYLPRINHLIKGGET